MFSVRMALSLKKKIFRCIFEDGYELLPGIYIQTSVYFIFFNFCQFPRRKMHCGF